MIVVRVPARGFRQRSKKARRDARGGPSCRSDAKAYFFFLSSLPESFSFFSPPFSSGFASATGAAPGAPGATAAARDRPFRGRGGFGGGDFFLDVRLRHDGGRNDRIDLAAHDDRHAGGQLQRRHVDRVADVERRQVDLDEFRQVLRQARDVELVRHVAHDGARFLDRWRDLAVDEVKRHFHVDPAILVDALEVDVQDLVLERVHLHVAQEHLRRAVAELHRQDRRVERLVAQRVKERVVVEFDRLRRAGASVHDARRLAGAAHPAARAATFLRARVCGEFELHGATPDVCGLPGISEHRSRVDGRPRLATSGRRNLSSAARESFEL